jgi:hypothetical protein
MKNDSKISTAMVIAHVESHKNARLFTLKERRSFRIRISMTGGVRFDRPAQNTYDTVTRSEIVRCVGVFNLLSPTERMIASKFQGKHHAASYIAALLNDVADRNPKQKAIADEGEQEVSTGGQGIGLTPRDREAVEDHGMDQAVAHFEERGWKVETKGKPYDLLCTKTGEKPLYVEVKATTGTAEKIIITAGEANFSRSNQVALFVLRNVKLKNGRASEGEKIVIDPWRFDPSFAQITHYRYTLK